MPAKSSSKGVVRPLHIWLAVSLLSVIAVAWWFAAQQPEPVSLVPTLTGEEEYCLTCHSDLPEISASHPIAAFGCVSCHGGERLALDAELAHSSMYGGGNPSSLAVVEQGCGGSECHSGSADQHRDHIQRVTTSVQATYAGAIASVRYAFGVQHTQTAEQGIFDVVDDALTSSTGIDHLVAFDPAAETHPMVQQFGDNCMNCHLSSQPLDGLDYARLDGCAACHTPTAGTDLTQPQHMLTTAIPYTQCNTCHNRGNYSLVSMEFAPRQDTPLGRLENYYQPIAQFVQCEYTLDCVDCHTRQEAMGDGDIHTYQADIQYVQCKTCHGTLSQLPLTYTISDPEDITLKMALLNPVMDLQVGDTIIQTEKGEPMWNARLLDNGQYELYGKATGQRFTFNPVMGSGCLQQEDQQQSQYCHQCHEVDH